MFSSYRSYAYVSKGKDDTNVTISTISRGEFQKIPYYYWFISITPPAKCHLWITPEGHDIYRPEGGEKHVHFVSQKHTWDHKVPEKIDIRSASFTTVVGLFLKKHTWLEILNEFVD